MQRFDYFCLSINNVHTWQLALLRKHLHLAMQAASQTFTLDCLQTAR